MNAQSSYEALVKPHLDELRSYCFFLTRSKWDGEDLFQETVLRAMLYFLHAEPYQNVKYFLIRVARNLWIDDHRSRKARQSLPMSHFPACYRDSDYAEVRSLLEWMGEHLPRRNVEMWLLCAYFRYTMEEAAEWLGCTVPAVKSVLHRTRVTLRGLERNEAKEDKAAAWMRLDVERWCRAIMQDIPPACDVK